MIAREAVLNDAGVVMLLRSRFVAVAVDNMANLNMTEAEQRFLSDKGLKASTAGMSVFAAGGRLLASGVAFEPVTVKALLLSALRRYDAMKLSERMELPDVARAAAAPDRPGVSRPPDGGLVLWVTWRVLGGYDRPEPSATTENGKFDEVFRNALGVDRLWVRKDEAETLASGHFPGSLRARMTPHLSDALAGTVEQWDLTIRGQEMTGTLHSDKGLPGSLRGVIVTKEGRLTRFDLVAKGWGERVADCGFSAGLTVVPSGRMVPVAVLFTLADPKDELAKVPPRRCREGGYPR